jgi:uncharacterized membrane protein YeaQ/YmgE (transglycosylase-associated protein family)
VILALLALVVLLFLVFAFVGVAFHLIAIAIIGLIIGALARLVVPGTRGLGVLPTVLLGLVGSIVGGFIGVNVLHLGSVLRILLEIGVAAVAVALFAAHRRREVGRGYHRQALSRW